MKAAAAAYVLSLSSSGAEVRKRLALLREWGGRTVGGLFHGISWLGRSEACRRRHRWSSFSPIITLSLILCSNNACHVALFSSEERGRKRQTRLLAARACFSMSESRPLETVQGVGASGAIIKLFFSTTLHICNAAEMIMYSCTETALRWPSSVDVEDLVVFCFCGTFALF